MTQDDNNRATSYEQCISRGVHTNRQARIRSANEAFAAAVGMDSSELTDQPLNTLFHGDVPTAVLAEILQAIRHGKVWSGILEMIGDNESPWWSRVTVAPVAGDKDNYLWTFAEANAADIDAAKSYYKQLRSGKKSLKKGYIAKLYKKMVDLPIGLKIAGFATLLTTALAVILTVTGLSTIHSILDDSEQQALAEYSHGLDTMIEGMGDEAAALASLVAALPETREALKNRDRASLESRFREAFEVLEKEFSIRQFQFHLPPAKSLLRVHKPEKWGDDLSGFRHTVVTANTEARTVVGVEKGKAGYGIRGVVPIIEEGKVLGSVEFGTSLASSFFKNFEKEYGVDAAFYSVEGDKLVPVGATIDLKTLLTPKEVSLLLEDGTLLKNQEIDGKHYGVMFRPLKDYSGKPVGIIGIARDRSLYVEKMSSLFVEKVTLSLIIILTTIFLAYWIARNISRPVQQAAEVAENISQGIYNNPIDARSEDETGKLLAAMAGMQATLGYNLHEARESAEENARIKTALDYIATNVTVSNADGELIFMNESCIRLFNQLATSHGERSDFDATSLVGTRLLDFFSDEGLRAIYARQLSEREVVEYELWDHQFKLTISPVRDEQGNYVARVTQWDDITDERNIGKEIKQIVDAAQNGDLSVQIGLEEKQGFYRDLSTGVNKMTAVIGQVIDDIAAAMHRVASGDLTAPIETEYRGVYGQVRESVNETIASLRKMVGDLNATSQQISSSSSEIQSGNDELSQRTEKQASNLETTAASMEEITGTVKQNAENAQESTALASEARDISLRGVDVVKNAIGAMESISESSTRIEEIIHVIDDIAFQTNLLALNAAVEAARAGEQGRGFAVVATEVRDLAGRSSEAAKQIKQLISDSVERVERGTSLVNEVGTTLDAINGSISQVNEIMAEIAHANHEQSVGIDQVNRAITQIDEVTQQNTALAEQTAAVAISLKQQSVELEGMIARFKLVPENDAAVSGHYLRAV